MVYGTLCWSWLQLTLWPLQSRIQHIYHGQPYVSVDPKFITLSQSQLYPSVRDFGFGFWTLDFILNFPLNCYQWIQLSTHLHSHGTTPLNAHLHEDSNAKESSSLFLDGDRCECNGCRHSGRGGHVARTQKQVRECIGSWRTNQGLFYLEESAMLIEEEQRESSGSE